MEQNVIRHPEESTTHEYTVFVNGEKLMNPTRIYDWAYQRGLTMATYLGLEFINPRSPLVIDKWSDGKGNVVLIQKSEI